MVKDMFTYISLNFEKLGYFNLLHKVTLECAPSFLAFLKFRGLWRLLRVLVCFTPGTPSPTENSFLTCRREGGWSVQPHPLFPHARVSWAAHTTRPSSLLSSAPRKSIREPLRQQHSACFTFSDSNFQGGVNQFPPSVLLGLWIAPDIESFF